MGAPARYRHITGAGDDGVVRGDSCILHHVAVSTAAAGQTVSLHDCATEGAAAPGNLVAEVALDAVGGVGFGPGIRLDAGLVAIVSGGAPDLTVVWS